MTPYIAFKKIIESGNYNAAILKRKIGVIYAADGGIYAQLVNNRSFEAFTYNTYDP